MVETINKLLLPFIKGLIRKFKLKRMKMFLVEGMMTRILVNTIWFIYDDTKICIIDLRTDTARI